MYVSVKLLLNEIDRVYKSVESSKDEHKKQNTLITQLMVDFASLKSEVKIRAAVSGALWGVLAGIIPVLIGVAIR